MTSRCTMGPHARSVLRAFLPPVRARLDTTTPNKTRQQMQRVSQLGSHLASSTTTTPHSRASSSTTTTTTMAQPKSDIHLYTAQTPNGIKVSMLLEELGLPYKVTAIDLGKNTQKEPWFLEINPNGRIPALTDTFTDGSPIRLFESGSIMQYLVDRYDTEHKVSYPRGSREYWEVNNWLFWQMGGLGPMQGQANHFSRYAPEKIQYGIDRYKNETRRLYRVMDTQLSKSKSGYLVGDKCTVADLSCWGWVAAAAWAGVQLDEFPNLNAWVDRIVARPACEKGRHVPTPHTMLEHRNMTEEELDKAAENARNWIQQSMKEDAKR